MQWGVRALCEPRACVQWGVRALCEPWLTTLSPATTRPNTTCLPSRCGVLAVVRKNCEPLVLRPALAMLSSMGCEWRTTPFAHLQHTQCTHHSEKSAP